MTLFMSCAPFPVIKFTLKSFRLSVMVTQLTWPDLGIFRDERGRAKRKISSCLYQRRENTEEDLKNSNVSTD